MDFDYDEFEKYNEYDEELEEEYEYEDDEAEGEIRVRPKKTTKKRVSRRSIFEMYEPSELESSHLTDQDNEIRATDLPERFQLRSIPVKGLKMMNWKKRLTGSTGMPLPHQPFLCRKAVIT